MSNNINDVNYPTLTNELYNNFNNFIFDKDILVLGKLLKRFEFFLKVKDMPGDIVELGVFKGSGIATFSKFLQIYCPNSVKKVIGFDLFDRNNDVMSTFKNGDMMNCVYDRVNEHDLSLDNINKNLSNLDKINYELVKGDICSTVKEYSLANPGFRISLLYIDVDLDEPSYHGLTHLWKHIIPGGIILFDEYQDHKFDESNGVDRFLKENNLEYNVNSTNWYGPDCYLIKK